MYCTALQSSLALHIAAAAGDAVTVKLLLRYKADPRVVDNTGSTPVGFAILVLFAPPLPRRSILGVTQLPLFGCSQLHHAARVDSLSVLRLLLGARGDDAGVEPLNANGETALYLAALNRSSAAVMEILKSPPAAAAVNCGSSSGLTPLHVATQLQDQAAIAALLEAGADVGTPTTEGETALHIVCSHGSPARLRQLLASPGAEAALDLQTSVALGKQTALHVALSHRDSAAARQLLALGAAVDKKDGESRRA